MKHKRKEHKMHPKAKLGAVACGGGWGQSTPQSQPEITRIQCVGDIGYSLQSKYFSIHGNGATIGDGSSLFLVYISLDYNGSPPGGVDSQHQIGIEEVDYGGVRALTSDDTAETIALAIAQRVNTGLAAVWTAVAVGGTVTITDASNGARTDASDVNTGFTITTTQQGA